MMCECEVYLVGEYVSSCAMARGWCQAMRLCAHVRRVHVQSLRGLSRFIVPFPVELFVLRGPLAGSWGFLAARLMVVCTWQVCASALAL